MLELQSRAVLLAALRPPEGFRVDRAVATTYTLDLTALLTAPLAFSLYDGLLGIDRKKAADDEGGQAIDPYALLKSVRAYAESITVYCQATRIANPPKYRPILGYIEGSVVQVQAPAEDGIFHPKVWVLRFLREADDQVRYRVLFLSRNLTFDRSWDTMLSLDGELVERTNAFAENHPLGDFVAALPGLAVSPVDARRKREVAAMADEIRRVKFELPEGFDRLRFHPLGIEGHGSWPFKERIERLLVVSPFISPGALAKLSRPGRGDVLVSRLDQLQVLESRALGAYESVHVLDDAAEIDNDGATEASTPAVDVLAPPSGLHAKLFVADDGWDAHVWTGSANATTAAFERNVEFLVQLTGKRKLFGVDSVLDGPKEPGGARAGGIRPLLASYTPPPTSIGPSEVDLRLEERLRSIRTGLGRVRWVAVVGEAIGGLYPFGLEARGPRLSVGDDVEIEAWPITLKKERAQRLRSPLAGCVADFGPCSFEALTSFVAFRTRASEGGSAMEETFVINASLEGAPENRIERILQSLLDDPAKVLVFLKILLATDPLEVLDILEPGDAVGSGVGSASGGNDAALLESLLRALDRDPARIDAVDSLVRDLSSTEAGRKSLPPEFEKIWEPIRAARASLTPRGRA